MAAKKKSGRRQGNGDADAAAALMREFGDLPDSECIQFDADGNEVFVPPYIREMRARAAAEEERERERLAALHMQGELDPLSLESVGSSAGCNKATSKIPSLSWVGRDSS